MSPENCLAARNLLRLSQAELAKLAKVSLATLRRFENGEGPTSAYAAKAILSALEREGILFAEPGRKPTLK